MPGPELIIEPRCGQWSRCLDLPPRGEILGHPLSVWREKTRRELGLDPERPVIATGHQTLMWHPGILVKYIAADAVARISGFATANLIVDQHAGGFGSYEAPIRRRDDALAVRRIELTRPLPEVPMSLHEPFTPLPPPALGAAALPSVVEGVAAIDAAVRRHANAPDAAMQMARALGDLMAPWVRPFVAVTASDLLGTSFAQALLAEMARDPRRCADAYNRAVAALPEAGIGALLTRDDYVELPLWRIRPDRRRMRAYDDDVARVIEHGSAAPRLMPRALMMTALIRLVMCDLFVHGTGGANYDRAMERWIGDWLGLTPAPMVVASASLWLPLRIEAVAPVNAMNLARTARRVWHDPEMPDDAAAGPGPVKRALLTAIDDAPRRSRQRRDAYATLHRELSVLRGVHASSVERAQRSAADARRHAEDAIIAQRRDWPFPLYERSAIDALVEAVEREVGGKKARRHEGA